MQRAVSTSCGVGICSDCFANASKEINCSPLVLLHSVRRRPRRAELPEVCVSGISWQVLHLHRHPAPEPPLLVTGLATAAIPPTPKTQLSFVCAAAGASAALSASSIALHQTTLIEASMEQLGMTLPPWAVRAGARKEIFFDPSQASTGTHRTPSIALQQR